MGATDKVIKPKPKKDLIHATESGDRLETLIALRDLLAERLQKSNSDRDIASMSRRLIQCVTEIEEIEAQRDIKKSGAFNIEEFRRKLSFQSRASEE